MYVQISPEFPQYLCHKKVWALKIKDVLQSPPDVVVDGGSWDLEIEDAGFSNIRVTHEWYTKHRPTSGGYFVVYADGYESFSPGAAFEEGYERIRKNWIEGLTFESRCHTIAVQTLDHSPTEDLSCRKKPLMS